MKKKIIKHFIISFLLIFSLTSPLAVQALNDSMPRLQIPIPNLEFTKEVDLKCAGEGKNKTCDIPWIAEYLAAIYKYAIGIIGILATVVMMIGGVIWLTSGGNAARITEAKSYIGGSLTGLVIALSSYMILYQINPDLVNLRPIRIGIVPEMDISAEEIIFTGGGGEQGTTNIPANDAQRNKYDNELKVASTAAGIDCTLLKAFMFAESSGNPDAISPVGAVGLVQLMPATAKQYGCNDLTDPQQNLNAGAKFIKALQGTACNNSSSNAVCNSGESKYIIAAYNGGPKANSVSITCKGQTYWECEANDGYRETRKYVPNVIKNYETLKNNSWGC